MDVTAAGGKIAELDGGKTALEDDPITGPIGTSAELVGTDARLVGIGAELVGTVAELTVTSAELVETSVGMLGTEEKDDPPNDDDNESELLLEDVGIIENPGKEGVFVRLPDVTDTEGLGRE